MTNYKECLDLILDYAPESDPEPEEWSGPLAKQARDLYGLIHARFIITQRGQQLMVRPRTPLDACAFLRRYRPCGSSRSRFGRVMGQLVLAAPPRGCGLRTASNTALRCASRRHGTDRGCPILCISNTELLLIGSKAQPLTDSDLRRSVYPCLADKSVVDPCWLLLDGGQEQKYVSGQFGSCPRAYCNKQPVLPVGLADECGADSVKMYCPLCQDIFRPSVPSANNIDGAYFGTTFPHLFLLSKPHLIPQKPVVKYVPRVFGFKLFHPSHLKGPSSAAVDDLPADDKRTPLHDDAGREAGHCRLLVLPCVRFSHYCWC